MPFPLIEELIAQLEARPRAVRAGGGPDRVRKQHEAGKLTARELLLDAAFGPMANPAAIAEQLNGRAGIVEHGLFLGLANDVVVAGKEGIRHLKRLA